MWTDKEIQQIGDAHDQEEEKKRQASKKNPKRGGYYYFTLSSGETVKLPAITSILGVLNKPFLVNWAAKKAAEIACESPWMSIDDITSKFRADNVMKASTTGKGVHNLWEKILKGEKIQRIPQYEPYTDALNDFVKQYKPHCVMSEQAVKSLKHGIAGTLDAVVTIGEEFWLIDLKTGKGTYPEHGLQLEFYKQAIQEDCGVTINKAIILHVPGDGTYSLVEYPGDMKIVMALKEVYEWKEGL